MIVVTGLGRSGTSALGLLYKELGFDPGGNWIPEYRAGLEHGDFWTLNNRLATELGLTMFRPNKKQRDQTASKSRVKLIQWDRVDDIVAAYGETMRRLAQTTPVVKDPRFLFTLPIWLAAGAAIEHVVITTRDLNDVIASRQAAGQSEFSEVELRNALTYGLGVTSDCLLTSGQPHVYLRFPEFLSDLDRLYDVLRFPTPITREAFDAAAATVFDHEQVHDWSANSPVAT